MCKLISRGFTLVEIMIAVAVIGGLAAVVAPSLTMARAEANLSTCIQNEKNIVSACQMYLAKEGIPDNTFTDFDVLLDGSYLKKIPSGPAGGDGYGIMIYGRDNTTMKASVGDCFVYCSGDAHKSLGYATNFPAVDAHGRVHQTHSDMMSP